MNSIDEVVRVAVFADSHRLSDSHARLLDALSQCTLAGFGIDICEHGVAGVSGGRMGPHHDLVHLLSPSPSALSVAREHDIPVVAGYGTDVTGLPVRDARLILSPGPSADAELISAGARPRQLRRWQPGVDPESFGPGHYSPEALPQTPDRINVLHIGVPEFPELLTAAFSAAAALEPRLHLVMADGAADLPRLYASADLLLHLSTSADFPLAVIEAQASGLPVLAVDEGAAAEVIEDGRTGVLVPPHARALAEAIISLARRATLRERLTVGGLGAVRPRTWERSLGELTAAWTVALSTATVGLMRAA